MSACTNLFLSQVAAASNQAARPAAHLGAAKLGFRGRIRAVRGIPGSLPAAELERRLVELGFVEDATVEVLHQGFFGADPIAVRVDGVTIALRRREAAAVLVDPLD